VECRLYAADLSDPAAADRLAGECMRDFPHASLLVNGLDLQEGYGRHAEPQPVGELLRINALS
jgi:NAD(P)-dependent dehydrogenase (short-subunit alcohol dehydrogenase family)